MNNRIRVEKGTFIITKKDIFGKYISVLPFGDIAEGIKETGFKYEVNNLTLTAELAQGVSNELDKVLAFQETNVAGKLFNYVYGDKGLDGYTKVFIRGKSISH